MGDHCSACQCRHILGQGMDDQPDWVSTCTPLQNQICYATWVTYTWVALLLRRPSWSLSHVLFTRGGIKLLTIQNYKAENVSVGLKSIVDFPSSHTHKWERFDCPGLFLVHNNSVFFKLPIRCLLVSIIFFVLFFFQLPYDYFSRQTVLTQWAQPFLIHRDVLTQQAQPFLHSP